MTPKERLTEDLRESLRAYYESMWGEGAHGVLEFVCRAGDMADQAEEEANEIHSNPHMSYSRVHHRTFEKWWQ